MRALLVLPLLAACGHPVDEAGAVGELGHLAFVLESDWYLDESSLTEVGIVTGHEQRIRVETTNDGRRAARDDADAIVYAMEPDAGVAIDQSGPTSDDVEDPPPPSLSITVAEPGTYTLLARLGDDLFDRLELRFDRPAALELTLYTRAPYEEDYVPLEGDGPTQVREGTQLAWLPIPLDAGGSRLAGDVDVTMSADPPDAVVPAGNVYDVNEDEVYGWERVPSLYFLEPGDVVVTLADAVNGGAGAHGFTVVE